MRLVVIVKKSLFTSTNLKFLIQAIFLQKKSCGACLAKKINSSLNGFLNSVQNNIRAISSPGNPSSHTFRCMLGYIWFIWKEYRRKDKVIFWNLNFANFVFASYSRLPGNDFLWKKTGTNLRDIWYGLYNVHPVVLETKEASTKLFAVNFCLNFDLSCG